MTVVGCTVYKKKKKKKKSVQVSVSARDATTTRSTESDRFLFFSSSLAYSFFFLFTTTTMGDDGAFSPTAKQQFSPLIKCISIFLFIQLSSLRLRSVGHESSSPILLLLFLQVAYKKEKNASRVGSSRVALSRVTTKGFCKRERVIAGSFPVYRHRQKTKGRDTSFLSLS